MFIFIKDQRQAMIKEGKIILAPMYVVQHKRIFKKRVMYKVSAITEGEAISKVKRVAGVKGRFKIKSIIHWLDEIKERTP